MKNYYDKETVKIPFDSNEYPESLKEIKKPPKVLYALGNLELLKGNLVAIVGTRKASESGRNIAFSLAQNLSNNNITIVSGLASRNR